jgi:hypothetical protein
VTGESVAGVERLSTRTLKLGSVVRGSAFRHISNLLTPVTYSHRFLSDC